MPKRRLDLLLYERGLAESRTTAQRIIMARGVLVEGRLLDKPGMSVDSDAAIELRGSTPPYVSRGGLKLAHALDEFQLSPSGGAALDVGASTGGFTDCLLQLGARHVYAVDVGHGQLHQKLREDPRVTSWESVNARTLPALPERVACCTVDVSFISLLLVLPPALRQMTEDAWLVTLIKPQFEAGPQALRKGVVRDAAVRRDTVLRILRAFPGLGLDVRGLVESPITGPAGNHEYLAYATLGSERGIAPEALASTLPW